MLKNVTVFRRLVFIGILLVGVSIMGIISLEMTLAKFKTTINGAVLVEGLGKDSKESVLQIRRNEKDIIINIGDPIKQEEYQPKWKKALDDTQAIYSRIKDVAPDYAPEVAVIQEGLAKYGVTGGKVLQDTINGQYSSAGEANDAMSIVAKAVIHKLQEDTETLTARAHSEAEEAIRTLQVLNTIVEAIMFSISAIAVAALWLIAKGIKTAIHDAELRIERLGKQDFTVVFDTDGRDEFSSMGTALNSMVNSLKNAFQEIMSVSRELGGLSTDVSGAAEELKTAADSQTDATARIAAAAEELSASADSMRGQAETLARRAEETFHSVDSGNASVKSVVDAISLLSRTMADSSEQVITLSSRSEQIGNIVQTIKDIASQTNLLALNAAIEAARAGEQGRGFAVVADEVRKLAEKTTSSTSNVEVLVSEIHNSVASVSDGIKNASMEMDNAIVEAGNAKKSFDAIMTASEAFSAASQDLASSTEEQTTATHSVAKDIEQIAQMTDEASATTHQFVDKSRALASHATNLRGVALKFQT